MVHVQVSGPTCTLAHRVVNEWVYIWQRVARTKLRLRPTIEVYIRLESRLDLRDEKNG